MLSGKENANKGNVCTAYNWVRLRRHRRRLPLFFVLVFRPSCRWYRFHSPLWTAFGTTGQHNRWLTSHGSLLRRRHHYCMLTTSDYHSLFSLSINPPDWGTDGSWPGHHLHRSHPRRDVLNDSERVFKIRELVDFGCITLFTHFSQESSHINLFSRHQCNTSNAAASCQPFRGPFDQPVRDLPTDTRGLLSSAVHASLV